MDLPPLRGHTFIMFHKEKNVEECDATAASQIFFSLVQKIITNKANAVLYLVLHFIHSENNHHHEKNFHHSFYCFYACNACNGSTISIGHF